MPCVTYVDKTGVSTTVTDEEIAMCLKKINQRKDRYEVEEFISKPKSLFIKKKAQKRYVLYCKLRNGVEWQIMNFPSESDPPKSSFNHTVNRQALLSWFMGMGIVA